MFETGPSQSENIETEAGVREGRRSGWARRVIEREIVEALPFYRRLAQFRLRSQSDAEDVAQAFALKALARAGQLRDPLAVRGWLRRIFETSLVDHCRASGRRTRREASFDLQLHDRVEQTDRSDPAPSDPGQVVARLLPRLKLEYAQIVREMDLLDRPRSEVAYELGITVNNLNVRLHRARAALRDQFHLADENMAAIAS